MLSISSDAKEIADNVEVFEVILLVKVSIVFGFPEATCAHMQARFTLLEADKGG